MISPLVPKNPLRSELIIHTDWTKPNPAKRKPHPPKRPKTCPGPDQNFKLIHSHKLHCRTENQTSKHSFKRRVESLKARSRGKKKKNRTRKPATVHSVCVLGAGPFQQSWAALFLPEQVLLHKTRRKRTKFVPSSLFTGTEEVIMFGFRSSLSAVLWVPSLRRGRKNIFFQIKV